MDQKVVRLAFMLALVGLVVVGVAAVVHAQALLPVCTDARYDFNGNGSVERLDLNAWKLTFEETGCQLGSRVSPDGCSPRLDVNADQLVTRADLDQVITEALPCFQGLAFVPQQ